MTFRVYCPSCRTPFDVDESLAGEKGLCPSCQTSFRIELPAEPQSHALSPATAGSPTESGIPFLRGQITLAALGLAAYAVGAAVGPIDDSPSTSTTSVGGDTGAEMDAEMDMEHGG